jgi:hypothetical protein
MYACVRDNPPPRTHSTKQTPDPRTSPPHPKKKRTSPTPHHTTPQTTAHHTLQTTHRPAAYAAPGSPDSPCGAPAGPPPPRPPPASTTAARASPCPCPPPERLGWRVGDGRLVGRLGFGSTSPPSPPKKPPTRTHTHLDNHADGVVVLPRPVQGHGELDRHRLGGHPLRDARQRRLHKDEVFPLFAFVREEAQLLPPTLGALGLHLLLVWGCEGAVGWVGLVGLNGV